MQKPDISRRVTFRELRLFVAAARAGSILRAANEIGLTQPALSRAVSELEKTLGVRLFDRTNRGITRTPYGEVLLRRATGAFEELRQAVDEMESLADASGGELRIGGTPTMCAGFLPAVIDSVLGIRPRFRFEVAELDSKALAGEVVARSIDVAIGAQHVLGNNGLVFERMFDDRLFIVAGAHHPLAGKRSVTLEEAARLQWVLPAADTPIAAQLRSEFRKQGIQLPDPAVTTMSISVRHDLIARHRFLTVLYGSVLRSGSVPKLVRVLPIDMATGISVGVIRLRGRTLAPSAEVFVQAARETARPLRSLRASQLLG